MSYYKHSFDVLLAGDISKFSQLFRGYLLSHSFLVGTFVRSVPGASIVYQQHLLSLKVMTLQTE